MQFMTALFGGTENTLLNSAFALGIVLVLIVLGLWALKLLTNTTSKIAGTKKRLVVVDTAQVDGKRRIILLRRDNVEHVIMTGGPEDLVIESGIVATEPVPAPSPARRPFAPQRPAAARPAPVSTVETPITPDRPVTREAVDRLQDLARPTPLKPRDIASLRSTGLLRREIIPMNPGARTENSAGAPDDSATSEPVDETNGQLRLGSRGRFFRGVIRGDRT
jgi:flagellar protein FliO/FliZ